MAPRPVEQSTRISGEADELAADEVTLSLGPEQRQAVVRWIAQAIRRELCAVEADEGGADEGR